MPHSDDAELAVLGFVARDDVEIHGSLEMIFSPSARATTMCRQRARWSMVTDLVSSLRSWKNSLANPSSER